MKKVFVVAGELSGDKLGAWYLNRLDTKNMQISAVGGDFLSSSGANIYERFEKLNVSGFVEILKKLRFILKFLNKLSHYILQNNFDEVVLVDFPGFNLKLAKKLKKQNANIKITYLSPPQVWIWGQWRIKKLKKYCDKLIVLYPFEVDWYKQRGIDVEYLGNSVYSKINSFVDGQIKQNMQPFCKDKNSIAIMPASRESELDKLLPIFADVVRRFKLAWPEVKIVLPLAESFSLALVESKLKKVGLLRWRSDIKVVQGEKEKLKALSKCCLAITKPGTVSLELALLKVPAVVIYKASWLTYFLAKLLVKINYMSLPNLLLKNPLYVECIQRDCNSKFIYKHASKLYKSSLNQDEKYEKMQTSFADLNKVFCLNKD